MVFFNHATRQMTLKIVYYGPGLCGKTTNLNTIYGKTSSKARGEMVSLNTETDRTLFFDLLPMDVGLVSGFRTKLQLYTVPGQVFYNSTRKLVLKGVDGIVFVVDSQTPMLDACMESYLNLEDNLSQLGLNLTDIPTVFQWNKRDLRNALPIELLEATFNPNSIPSFQAVASDGSGVFETLRGITRLALSHIKSHVLSDPTPVAVPMAAPRTPEAEALTLEDLPSPPDLLDLEGPAAPADTAAPTPLADDDDDSGPYIEAPALSEPPEVTEGDLPYLLEDEDMLPPAGPETELLLGSAVNGSDRVFEGGIPTPAPGAIPAPDTGPVPPAAEGGKIPRPAKPPFKLDSLEALASLQLATNRPIARPRTIDHSPSIDSLLGELTQAGISRLPAVLRIEVPPDLDGQEIDVVVQLRRQGQVLVEGKISRPLPGKGGTSKLSVELKRS